MYKTQKAIIAHLNQAGNATIKPVPAQFRAETIKEYEGEFTGTMRGGNTFPAILVLYRDGSALEQLPDLRFELFFVSDNKYHDSELAKKHALQMAEPYCEFLSYNRRFEDDYGYYEITEANSSRLTTMISNHKWCVMSLNPVIVSVDRHL